jgi:hypothetical protein
LLQRENSVQGRLAAQLAALGVDDFTRRTPDAALRASVRHADHTVLACKTHGLDQIGDADINERARELGTREAARVETLADQRTPQMLVKGLQRRAPESDDPISDALRLQTVARARVPNAERALEHLGRDLGLLRIVPFLCGTLHWGRLHARWKRRPNVRLKMTR